MIQNKKGQIYHSMNIYLHKQNTGVTFYIHLGTRIEAVSQSWEDSKFSCTKLLGWQRVFLTLPPATQLRDALEGGRGGAGIL